MAPDWVLQVDLQEPQRAAPALDVLAEAWAVLLASPPQTVVAITDEAGCTVAMKTSDLRTVMFIPF